MKLSFDTAAMKEMWEKRYSQEAYVYGIEANDFFSARLQEIPAGRILLPGEGEGRNAVHALKKGWKVSAFDLSEAARKKAMELAGPLASGFDYHVCDLEEYPFGESIYDAAALVFFHTEPKQRKLLHSRVTAALKPGGMLILQAFHKSQIGKSSGGPQNEDLLMDRSTLKEDFPDLKIQILEEHTIKINEGPFHQGEASVISHCGIKI